MIFNRNRFFDQPQRFAIQNGMFGIKNAKSRAFGQKRHKCCVINKAKIDQHLAKQLAGHFLFLQGDVQLVFSNQPLRDQPVADPARPVAMLLLGQARLHRNQLFCRTPLPHPA